MTTKASDIAFRPKVWSDHVMAYFDQQLGIASLAKVDRTLTASPGETVNFPYYKRIGAAEKPGEDDSLQVDKLSDDAFPVTVEEVGKAVGWKDKAHRVSANGPSVAPAEAEAQRQMARVFAEQAEADCIVAMNSASVQGTVGSAAAHTANIRSLLVSKVTAFGDKQNQAKAVIMHSQDFVNIMSDATAGFLHANATMPMYGRAGFMGQLLGMGDVFVLDSVPQAPNIDGKKAWYHYFLKEDPFGIYMAADVKLEKDRDILARENVMAGTLWYGTLSLHGKVSSLDLRVGRGAFASTISA